MERKIDFQGENNTSWISNKILPITNKTYSLARVIRYEMMIEKSLVINQRDKTMERLGI